jgi:8-oxo-dGTP pyrophosphatase MutT (NUDIX family)
MIGCSDTGMAKAAFEFGVQYAALPFRVEPGGLRVLVITSRETRRWIIPKGWPIRGLKPREVAAREALEEVGLVGRIVGKHPIGSYHYTKRLPQREMLCAVKVFLLSVDCQLDEWLEKGQREWRWVDPFKAAQMVEEGGLAEILRSAFPSVRRLEPVHMKRRRLPR